MQFDNIYIFYTYQKSKELFPKYSEIVYEVNLQNLQNKK